MHTFCTRCGHRNENLGSFCDNCGAPLKQQHPPIAANLPPVTTQATANHGVPQTLNPQTKKRLLIASGLTVVLLVGGGGGLTWWLQPPQATPANLLASARVGLSEDDLKQLRQQLCIGNTDYRITPFNVNIYDQRTRNWFDTLVTAGLYLEPETAQGGFMGDTLLRYVATPELEKYRDGSRLCVASGVELTAVDGIQSSGKDNSLTLAQVTVRSKGLAPWMSNVSVRDSIVNGLRKWEWKDGSLQRQIEMSFLIQDRKWVTGSAVQNGTLLPQVRALPNNAEQSTPTPNADSWWTKLTSIFNFSSNPLHGTWRQQGGSIIGIELPAGISPNITFKSTSMEVSGTTLPVTYEINGDRITVILQGKGGKQVFVMQGKDEMVIEGMGIHYLRSK